MANPEFFNRRSRGADAAGVDDSADGVTSRIAVEVVAVDVVVAHAITVGVADNGVMVVVVEDGEGADEASSCGSDEPKPFQLKSLMTRDGLAACGTSLLRGFGRVLRSMSGLVVFVIVAACLLLHVYFVDRAAAAERAGAAAAVKQVPEVVPFVDAGHVSHVV